MESKNDSDHAQLKDLAKYLGVPESLEDDLFNAEEARLDGTCEWFANRDSYCSWLNPGSPSLNILWVSGKPAAGKTVLSGFIINELQRLKQPHGYFFFRHGERSKSRLSQCLRALAFQMAKSLKSVRELLLKLKQDDVDLNGDNDRSMWRKLFVSGVFEMNLPCYYWIIDGLDECANFLPFFDVMLSKLNSAVPLRILITSRNTAELGKSFHGLEPKRLSLERIGEADTTEDIKLFIQSKAASLNVEDEQHRTRLVDKILAKAQGSFLWTVLVLKELSTTYSDFEIETVLEEVPPEMEALYLRTVESMGRATRDKTLVKAILCWVTCSGRLLTIHELDAALRWQIKDRFPKLDETAVALCGQFVAIDRLGKLRLIHETAREFLLGQNLESEFAIDLSKAHTQLSKTCLTYLAGDEMKPPRTVGSRRMPNTAAPALRRKNDFAQYACAFFAYHIARADSLDHDLVALVKKFLKTNIVSWVEAVSMTGELHPLIGAARALAKYSRALANERSPLDEDVQLVRGWSTDLVRIAAKFSSALTISPSSIYSLIPPFCPKESQVYKASISGRKLTVLGLPINQWDDRLSCIGFQRAAGCAVCYGDEFIAVGLTSGYIFLYHGATCQWFTSFKHGEAVRFLRFKPKSDLLVSCGMKTVKVWDVRRDEEIHCFKAPPRPIALEFDDDSVVVASTKNYLAIWNLGSDPPHEVDKSWNDGCSDASEGTAFRGQSSAISISTQHKMMAVAYNGRPIVLWDLEGDAYFGTTGKRLSTGKTSTHLVTSLAFNPNPNVELLAVCYLDGELVIINPFTDEEVQKCRANCPSIVASPDGRLLAGSPGDGTIHVYEFDTLRLVYRVTSSNIFIRQIVFSPEGNRLADIRGGQCNIWEPMMLLQDTLGDDSSDGTSFSTIDTISFDPRPQISVLAPCTPDDFLLVGTADGSLNVHDIKTGEQLKTLYKHKSAVRHISWSSTLRQILSVDSSNGVLVWELQKHPSQGLILSEQALLSSRLDSGDAVTQALVAESCNGRFILSTRSADFFCTLNGLQEPVRDSGERPRVRAWFQHPKSPSHAVCLDGTHAHIHRWEDGSEITRVSLGGIRTGLQFKKTLVYNAGAQIRILLEMTALDGMNDSWGRAIVLLDGSFLSTDMPGSSDRYIQSSELDPPLLTNLSIGAQYLSISGATIAAEKVTAISRHMSHLLAVLPGGKVVFLNPGSWVCSADLESLIQKEGPLYYSRHFFVPLDWFAGSHGVVCSVNGKDVILARAADSVIVKGGLDFVETVVAEDAAI